MFYGWWIVILVFFAGVFGGATIWYGFTAYFDPLINEFGWSYTAISIAASLRSAEVGLLDAPVGFLIDRWGSRRIVFVSSILVCIGFLMLSRVNSLTTFYIAFAIIACGATGFGSVVFKAELGQGTVIKHKAVVEGVNIPSSKVVPSTLFVDSQSVVEALSAVTKEQQDFAKMVIAANQELLRVYKNGTF